MAKIEIYTKSTCSYCQRAKDLLTHKRLLFQEISIDNNPCLREEMIKRSSSNTVPQIFIDGKYIGGCNDLYALDERGDLSCYNQ